jgi:uncharacterized LabA/DUF88 family protein
VTVKPTLRKRAGHLKVQVGAQGRGSSEGRQGDENMKYVYIDGGSLEVAITKFSNDLAVENVPFDYLKFINELGADRAFYYSSLPAKRENESIAEYEKRRSSKDEFFSRLNRVPRLHVRTGTSRWAKKRGQSQKAVDVLLAVDAMSHAHSHADHRFAIVTSDLDFQPLLNALLQMPVSTTIYCRANDTNVELLESSDFAIKITQNLLLRSCETSFSEKMQPTYLPNLSQMASAPSYAIYANFMAQAIDIWEDEEGFWLIRHSGGAVWRAKTLQLIAERLFGDGADDFIAETKVQTNWR